MISADMTNGLRRLLPALLIWATTSAAAAAQAAPGLTVRRGEQTVNVSPTDLGRLPRVTIEAVDHDKPARFEGVRLVDVLTRAGVTFGQTLRGVRLASYLLAEAPDGYRVVFALPEIDPEFAKQDILIADRMDGNALPARDGPLRLIVPADKKHARWVRGITTLSVVSASDTR